MKIWKDFLVAAKGKEATFIVPEIYPDGITMIVDDELKITDEALIWTGDDGDVRWLRLDKISQGRISTPSE